MLDRQHRRIPEDAALFLFELTPATQYTTENTAIARATAFQSEVYCAVENKN